MTFFTSAPSGYTPSFFAARAALAVAWAAAGSAQRLKSRALQLVGGPDSPTAPEGRSLYALLLGQGSADVFVTYCTNATLAVRGNPALQVLPLPQNLDVAATYGLSVLLPASPGAEGFAAFLRSPDGRAVLRGYGFNTP
jgi:ABC-type molybdate transport system substrate-binding protein